MEEREGASGQKFSILWPFPVINAELIKHWRNQLFCSVNNFNTNPKRMVMVTAPFQQYLIKDWADLWSWSLLIFNNILSKIEQTYSHGHCSFSTISYQRLSRPIVNVALGTKDNLGAWTCHFLSGEIRCFFSEGGGKRHKFLDVSRRA